VILCLLKNNSIKTAEPPGEGGFCYVMQLGVGVNLRVEKLLKIIMNELITQENLSC